MPADANLVKKTVDAVKEIQSMWSKESVGAIYSQIVDSNAPAQTKQDTQNKMMMITKQSVELIILYKKIDTSVFMEFSGFWLIEISNLATRHHKLLASINRADEYERSNDEIIETLENAYHDFFQVIAPMLGAMVILDNDYEKSKDAARIFSIEKENFNALRNTLMNKHRSWEKDNVKLKAEIAEILQSARGASAETWAVEQASFFDKQGKEHETKQKNWLWASVSVTVVLLIYLAVSYYFSSLPDVWAPTTILQATIRAFAFSLLLFVLIFCVKNYKAHGHNYIVNIHRAKSLQTYGAIVHAAKSPDAQDIIMANVAQHIFTPLDTGYVKGADSVGNPTMEIIRSGVKLVDGKE